MTRVQELDRDFQAEVKKVEDIEKEMDGLRKQRTRIIRDLRNRHAGQGSRV